MLSCYVIELVIDEIIDDVADEGVCRLLAMNYGWFEIVLLPPLYEGLLSKEVARAETPLFN